MELSKESVRLEPDIQSALLNAQQSLFPLALNRLPHNRQALFGSTNNRLAIVLTTEFNCTARISDDKSRFDLFMNYGLLKGYAEMTRLFSRGLPMVSESDLESGQSEPQPKNASPGFDEASVARELMEAFWNKTLE
jgi:hypothetical protein